MKKSITLLFVVLIVFFGFYLYKTQKHNPDSKDKLSSSIKNKAQTNPLQKTGPLLNFDLTLPSDYKIGIFATHIVGVRDLQFDPEGTLLASETSQGRVVALPDKNNDGVSDKVVTLISSLNNPHGLAFFDSKLFVAQENEVDRYNYDAKSLTATFDKKLFDLPKGGRHFTRSLVFDKKGNLYVSIGSTCDTCVEKNPFISTVLISDSNGRQPKVFSSGLRNAVFLAVNPLTDVVWATEMGRDFLGSKTPLDEIDILQKGGNYGWPYCYGDKIVDATQKLPNPDYCKSTIAPYFEIPAHSAPLGLAFQDGNLFVAYHGSMNKSLGSGYKVVEITTGPNPKSENFITGFIKNGTVLGRPVDITFDKFKSMYVSDDFKGNVYKVVKTSN